MFSLLQILSNSLESSNKIENIINKYKLNTLVGSDVLFAIFILYDTFGNRIFYSIMNQYTPVRKCKYDELNGRVEESVYDEIIDYAWTDFL